MISFKVSQESLRNLEKTIAKKVAEVTAQAASVAYNTAITYDGPVWSGTWRASWQISVGAPGNYVLQHPSVTMGKPDVTHKEPSIKYQDPLYGSPYTPLYVSNTAHHAYKVEYEGTKTHPDGGWLIALHAKNQTLQKYRLF